MRSLWTAASGMEAQQLYIDSIANNLANVNTSGYKKESLEFKSLLYETLSSSSVDENGYGSPVSLQVGHGVRAAGNVRDFSQGSLEVTENPLDFAITGDGFFVANDLNGDPVYTKQGSFKISPFDDKILLVTTDGYPVLDSEGETIEFDETFSSNNLSVDALGNMTYADGDEIVDLDIQLGLVQFKNPAGLDAIGGSYYTTTIASGEAMYEADEDDLTASTISQGMTESSNVQVVEEMVNMIVAQRAYEMNSKAIQTADDMLSTINGLKR
jgi:flagellar basal-body rod protein FlgG